VKKFSRVLVAVDLSKPARGAFEYALALSQRHGAELVAIQAVPLDQAFNRHAHERRALAEKLRRRAERANVAFTDRVQQGDPAETILLHASSLRADLIVAGTHQRRGFTRFKAGSVAERVAAKASVPVLLIPQRPGTVRPLSHVVVAVDLHGGSSRAVEEALALAPLPTDRVTLVHVVPGSGSGVQPHSHRYGVAEYQGELLRDARRRLPLALPMKRQSVAAIDSRIVVGDTTSEITSLVDDLGADLLVVGVPRRGVVSRALFGATAARLLRVSRVPVLAVPEVDAATAPAESDLQLAA
jgi:nucleotide-binding universal stress UspA family protein